VLANYKVGGGRRKVTKGVDRQYGCGNSRPVRDGFKGLALTESHTLSGRGALGTLSVAFLLGLAPHSTFQRHEVKSRK
jgi:hypothetical protein